MRKFSALFMIMVGLMVLSLWTFLISTHQVPELKTEFWSIITHISAEILMALLLIRGGIGILRISNRRLVSTPFALGTLAYSLINSSGYYLEKGEPLPVMVFAVLLFCTLLISFKLIKSPESW